MDTTVESDDTLERRRLQNRMAQRRFRQSRYHNSFPKAYHYQSLAGAIVLQLSMEPYST